MNKPARIKTVLSQFDFPTTVARFEAILAAKSIRIFAKIDQQDAANQVGSSLRPTVLFLFGNPKGGTPVMQQNPHAAIELPLRAVVWEDDEGKAFIDYQDTALVMLSDYGVSQEVAQPLSVMKTLIETVSGQA